MSHSHAHDHHHDHDHPYHHHDTAEVRAQPVLLDLGDGIGALIVHTGPELLGIEIEISPAGDDTARQHKEVLRRSMGAAVATVLVYDNLEAGEYTLWLDNRPVARDVRVADGRVSEHTLARGAPYTSSVTSSNRSTSTSPRSVILSAGMTESERNASI